jgi:hypothetical protein
LLKARVRHALKCPVALFPAACAQIIAWVNNHPILGTLVADLKRDSGGFREHLEWILEQARNDQGFEGKGCIASSYREHSALCLGVVATLAGAVEFEYNKSLFLIHSMHEVLTGEDTPKHAEALEVVRDVAVTGLYEYLDEQIDSRNAIVGVLLKYKHRCEWFRRQRLREVSAHGLEGRQAGERALAVDLAEYIYNQGVDFTIEPASASGEADLILRDADGRHLIIDAKYIAPDASPSKVKKKIGEGFHQVARYCDDHDGAHSCLIA